MTWRPILDDDTRERALAAIRAVADALREPPAELGVDLAAGAAGLAVFYHYVGCAEIGVADAPELAAVHLERAIDAVAAVPMPPALHGGFAGIAWAAQHLYGDDTGEALDEIDAMLLELVEQPEQPYDLAAGAVGIGVYAIERDHGALLERVVRRLDAAAQRDGHVRHGGAAAIPLLAQAAAREIERAGALCRDAIRGLLESAGDELAIAAPLAAAAGLLDDRALLDDAARIARRADARARDSGLRLLRLHHATGDAAFADAARRWVAAALDDLDPRAGERGLLRGAAGVALSLLAASTAIEPAWDRALALSTRR